jgi:hypothetical protein
MENPKGFLLFFLLMLLTLNFVLADTSVDLTTGGCERDSIHPLGVNPDRCDASRSFYCNTDSLYENVLTINNACLYGTNGSFSCCPNGYNCVEADGNSLCKLMENDCSYWTTQPTCESTGNNCYWDDRGNNGSGICVYPPATCGDFATEDDCTNITSKYIAEAECAKVPYIDSEGVFYVVPVDNCTCSWNNDITKCELNYTVTSTIGDGFLCNKQYDYGECTDGIQPYEIIAIYSGNTTVISQELLQAFDCLTGDGTRICGVKLIQVPFFAWFNLFIVLFLIAVYYIVKINKKDIEKSSKKRGKKKK